MLLPRRLSLFMLPALIGAGMGLAQAGGCSRTIQVPLAPVGVSVTVDGNRIGGIYPRMLERISERSGCVFKTSAVPQARLELLFASGAADLLMPAIQTPRRDELGSFIALTETRAMLVSLDQRHTQVHSLGDLLQQRGLRVAVVRGNDYGDSYQAVLRELEAQGRLYKETYPEHVARLLSAGMADVTLITPLSLVHAMRKDGRTAPLVGRLQIQALQELGWRASGVYLSKRSLSEDDRSQLASALREQFHSDEVWDAFRRHYPAELLNQSLRRH